MNEFKQELRVERNYTNNNNQQRYYSTKGSVQRAQNNKKKNNNKFKMRTVAAVLAAISIGAASGAIPKKYNKNVNISKIVRQYEIINQTGLSQENIKKLQQLEYCDDIDSNELYKLTLDIINNKMSDSMGWDRKETQTHYRVSAGEGQIYMTIENYADKYSEEPTVIYTSRNYSTFKNKRTLPNEIEDAIMILHKIDNIENDMARKNCSKENEQKKLRKCIKELNNFAASEITIDKDGNLVVYSLKDIEKMEKNKLVKKEEQER